MSFPSRVLRFTAPVLCWGFLLLWPFLLSAETVILSPVADTTLFQTLPDYNLGGVLTLVAGTTFSGGSNRALIQFDVATALPPDAILQDVTLTLTVTRTSAMQPHLFRLHRMKHGWTEGTGAGQNTGEPAQPGQSTWETVSHPDVRWSSDGAAAPVDFEAAASAELPLGGPAVYDWVGSSNLLADVQRWRADPQQNFGWILVCAEEALPTTSRRIASREDLTNAPQLTLSYVLPGRLSVDLPAVADTSLFEYLPQNNLGATDLAAGSIGISTNRARALMQFLPGPALPAAAVLTAAQLRLSISRVSAAGGQGTGTNFLLHRMLTTWGEGSKGDLLGRLATDGEATWLARFAPDTLWAQPGAAAGVDYVEAPSAVQFMDRSGPTMFTNVIEDVLFWVRHPEANYGWILIGGAEDIPRTARRFSSREDPLNGPTLHLEYLLPPRLDSISAGRDQITFSFDALPWNRYVIECSDALSGGTWQACTNLPPSAVAGARSVTLATDAAQRFYRLALRY